MLEITTEDYIIFIDMNYLLREIDIKEDDDALKRSPKELYERIIDNLYWDEMVEEWVLTYKHRITSSHPEEQFFDKPKDILIHYA